MKRKAKTPAKPRLQEQAHGGALVVGGYGQGGRPVEKFRRECREAFAEKNGIAFVAKAMAGEITETVTVTVGVGKDARTEVVQVPPKLRDRLYAAQMLMEHGHGKPPQEVKVEEPVEQPTTRDLIKRAMELLPHVIAVLPLDKQALAKMLERRRRIELLVQGKVVRSEVVQPRP